MADLGVALVHHDLAVDLVGRAVEQAVGHHVVEHGRHDPVLAHEREAFAHRLDRAAEHEIVGDLDRGRGGRIGAGLEGAPPDGVEQRLAAASASAGPPITTAAWPDATISGRPSIGAATRIWLAFRMRRLESFG